MDAQLTIIEGPLKGLVFRAKGRTAITLGRSKTTDFHVLDASMSRVHAVVAKDDRGWYVEDRKSRNGVWMGGRRVERARLEPGATFQLGQVTVVRFELITPDQPRVAGASSISVVVKCARCGEAIADAAELTRAADGRPYHLACRDLEHLVGTELGGFKVVERLPGRGPAFFFRAHQETLNRHVVLELFDPPVTARPGFREALLEEVRRASRYLHPNVLQIYDFGEARGASFVVMEHFQGAPLSTVLEDRRFVKIREAVSIARQLTSALDYAREQGAQIAWIGPSSVLVSPANEVKLELFREPGASKGPPVADAPYAAPEVLSGDARGQDASAAVYSVGAILYHMLAGIPPFEGGSVKEITARVRRESPPALRRINLKVSPALAHAVEAALERKPAARPQSIAEFAATLEKASAPPR